MTIMMSYFLLEEYYIQDTIEKVNQKTIKNIC